MATEILIRKDCPDCDNGIIYNPLWTEFNIIDDDHRNRTGHFMTVEECEDWFASHGHSGKLPPEEYQCDTCNGTAKVQEWISIGQLHKALKEYKLTKTKRLMRK